MDTYNYMTRYYNIINTIFAFRDTYLFIILTLETLMDLYTIYLFHVHSLTLICSYWVACYGHDPIKTMRVHVHYDDEPYVFIFLYL